MSKFVVLGADRSNYCRYYQTKPDRLNSSLCSACPDSKECKDTIPKKEMSKRDKERLSYPPSRWGSSVFSKGEF